MINMELPVIGEPDIESSVIRGFHLHKVSWVSWSEKDVDGFDNSWSFGGSSRKDVDSELLIWFEHDKAGTEGYSAFPGVEIVDLNCTVEWDLAGYGLRGVGSFVAIELRE